MSNDNSLISRVAALAAEESEALPPKASPAQLAKAEAVLGFTLPPLLARLYLEVADGGFGPGYELFPLHSDTDDCVVAGYQKFMAEQADSGERFWPTEVLPILDWGCGMYAAVDCRDPRGTVLLHEPNGVEPGHWADSWFLDAPSLSEWLEGWLADSAWFAETTDEPRHGSPQPWEQAAARLA